MLNRVLIALLFACFVLFCGGLFADGKDPNARAESPKEGPFKIVSAGDSVFKFDESSGASWVLRRRKGGEDVGWFPIPLLKHEEAAAPIGGAPPVIPSQNQDVSRPASLNDILVKRGYVRIKLNRMQSGYLNVKVKANGHDLNLIVDTGAPTTHFDRKRTERIGLKWQKLDERGEKDLPALESERYWQSRIKTFDLDKFKLSDWVVRGHDLTDMNNILEAYGDSPIDGVLGSDVMRHGLGIVDFKTHSLYLLDRTLTD